MVRIYNFTKPTLLIRELELVKTVMQTNFTSFHENALKINPAKDPLLAHNQFFTTGENWTMSRKRLTYAFSSMRLKILFERVKQVCEKFESYVDRKIGASGKVELKLKNLFSRYTSQVVAAAGFGVDGHCFDDEKEHESFHAIGETFLNSSFLSNLNFLMVFYIPFINKIFKMNFLPKKIDRFFRTMITDLMEQRRTETTPRSDFLQLMADLEKMEGDKFDIELLASHAVAFFVDGYKTSSSVLSFIGFNLVTHPAVQEKLREEVMSVLEKYDGMITYEALKGMTYMDQVMNESQRITSTVGFFRKTCTEEIELRGSDGLVCRVERGTPILIPVQALHKDPQYWENSELFEPERFGPDRKNSLPKYAFLPFGEEPRMCVGMRMAVLQIKACLATFLRKYSLELSSKTKVPLKMIPAAFLSVAEGGIWVNIRRL